MRTLKILALAIIVLLATAGLAVAGDKLQARDQTQTSDQLRDGSCQTVVVEPAAVTMDVVATDEASEEPARDQTRLRDGSCEDCGGDAVCGGDQTRTKKRSQARTQDQTQTQAGTQEQTQTQTQTGTQTQEQTQTQTETGTQTQAGNAWDDDEAGHEGDGECGDGSGEGGSGGGGH